MAQVFTKKHFKSNCLALFFLCLAFHGLSLPATLSLASGKVQQASVQSPVLDLAPHVYGTYEIVQRPKLEEKNIKNLNALLDELPFYVRPIASPRLKKAAQSFVRFEITSKQGSLGIKTDKFKSFVWTKVDGKYHDFKNTPKGDFKLRRWIESGTLYTEANKKGALKVSRYEFSEAGILRLGVTVTSKYLTVPLKLNYQYRKIAN
jgi:hypothetical protein